MSNARRFQSSATWLSELESVRLWPWRKVFLVVGLTWALLVVMPDIFRLWGSLAAFNFQADNDGKIYAVNGSARSSPLRGSIQVGERIQLTSAPCWHPSNSQCRNLLAVFGGMGGLSYVLDGTATTLPIVRRDGTIASTSFHSTVKPLDNRTKFILALDELAAAAVLWFAFHMAWNRPGRMTLGFFLYAMWFNPGQYFTTYAWLQQYPWLLLLQEILQALCQGAGYAGFMVFVARFPHDRQEAALPRVELWATLLGATLIALQLVSFTNVFGMPTELVTRLAILGGYAVAIGAFAIVLYRLKLQAPVDYQRMLWVLWGCLIGLPSFIFADSNEATSLWARYIWNLPFWRGWQPDEFVFEICYLLSGLLTLFFCSAVHFRRVINVTIELRAVLASAIVIILGAILENLIHAPVHRILANFDISESFQFCASVILLAILGIATHSIAHSMPHLLNRRLYHVGAELDVLSKNAVGSESLDAIDKLLVTAPIGWLNLASAANFRGAAGTYNLVYSSGGWKSSYAQLLTPHPNTAFLNQMKQGITYHLPSRAPGYDPAPEAIAEPVVAIPITFASKLYAVTFYGGHDTGTDLDKSEIRMLEKFAKDIATSYEVVHLKLLERENELLRLSVIQDGLPPPESSAQTN
jgi:hypothetical protein